MGGLVSLFKSLELITTVVLEWKEKAEAGQCCHERPGNTVGTECPKRPGNYQLNHYQLSTGQHHYRCSARYDFFCLTIEGLRSKRAVKRSPYNSRKRSRRFLPKPSDQYVAFPALPFLPPL